MKIFLGSIRHNANIGIVTWKSLEAAGHTVIGGHSGNDAAGKGFQYPSRMPLVSLKKLLRMIKEERPDVVHLYCFDLGNMNGFLTHADKVGSLIVRQTGTAHYRKNRTKIAPADVILVETEDLVAINAHSQLYWPPPDWSNLPEKKTLHDTPHIAHLPRGAEKGTPLVVSTLEKLEQDDFSFTQDIRGPGKTDPWPLHINRMAKADIYINKMSPTHKGKNHIGTDVTAREACALGCIVVNLSDQEVYRTYYGADLPLVTCTPDTLYATLAELISLPSQERFALAHRLHARMVQKHHFKPSGEYLTKIYEQALAGQNGA